MVFPDFSHVLLSTWTSHVFMLMSSLRSRPTGLPAAGSRCPKCRYQLFDFLVYIRLPCFLVRVVGYPGYPAVCTLYLYLCIPCSSIVVCCIP
ncbi:uncharacterized protein SCHCODRAFT_02500518 [Schizophyllum commune H4-8]|uniref:uncharacterized protein n=1 Tax=Schizophyllum commune (strain H4-8 / FGSC 9210) TaxID=578458 RepID=UPI00215ECAA3|nr:uncharacterized protein SCHCODRAFT_02500518 [Schizophyllum commune H4-8]KAI5894175.1 hypothetical protein SCHCODRAFT_02500518 [Schizophyllum commune H4-8]